MDLIDREQTIEKVRAVADDWLVDIPEGSYKAGFSMGTHIAIQTIYHDVPSAEKTGEWIKLDGCDTVQCSVCLEDFDYTDGLCYLCHGQELPNYCPSCGARMVNDESAD